MASASTNAATRPHWFSATRVGIPKQLLAQIVSSLLPAEETTRSAKRKLNRRQSSMSQHIQILSLPSKEQPDDKPHFIANVVSFMQTLATQTSFFMSLLSRVAFEHAGTPLQLLVYCDEVTPGNVLAPDHTRKSYLVYISFTAFRTWLSHTGSWLPIAVIRSKTMESLEGNFSEHMLGCVLSLQQQLCKEEGLAFCVDQQSFWLQVDPKFAFVADEAAIKGFLGCKGASGVKPCVKCKNVLYKRANSQEGVNPYFVTVSEYRCDRFDPTTDSDVETIINFLKLESTRKTPRQFEKDEKLSGFNLIPTGLLCHESVRATILLKNILYDPMHIYLSNGLIGEEMVLFFKALNSSTALSWTDFETLVAADWTQCSAGVGRITKSERRAISRESLIGGGHHYKGGASQLLSLLPFLLFFLGHIVEPTCPRISKQVKSFLSLLLAARQIDLGKKGGRLDAELLLELQSLAQDLFCQAYGRSKCRPKHHYQFHLAEQYKNHDQVIDCFTPERKNAEFKNNIAPLQKRLSSFERSCLELLLLQQQELDERSAIDLEDGLKGPVSSSPELAQALGVADLQVASSVRQGNVVMMVGCFRIFQSTGVGVLVRAYFSSRGAAYMLGEVWDLESERFNFAYSWWTRSSEPCAIMLVAEALAAHLH